MTEEIQALIKSKNKAKRQADRSADPTERCYFQQLKNELKASIRQAKNDYLEKLMKQRCTDSAHGVWAHVNALFGRNTHGGNIHSSSAPMDLSTLNSINDHFQNVAISFDHGDAVQNI